ncbi:MAG: GMC oxidoreductase [Solirubrobacteraceae bacterium]
MPIVVDGYDYVVIGSGFGGSIAACRLAQAGHSVCVLERGQRWARTSFPRTPTQIASKAFWDVPARQFGLIDYRAFPGMQVIQGSGVGGGSLHYFNVHLRAPASIFEDPRWPEDVDLETLEPYYRLAHEMLDAAPLSPPDGRELPSRTTVFRDACRAAGREPELVSIAVYTGPGRRNPHGGAKQLTCDYSGNCGIGCATQAKNTLDLNYLALAELHGAIVRPLHQVEVIEPLRGAGFKVGFTRLDPDDPAADEPGSLRAERVVVAAGTLGSNELLLRCRDVHGTLGELSPALGRGFSGNGDLLLSGAEMNCDVDASSGPSITAGVEWPTSTQEAYVEDLGLPDPMLWFIEGMLANENPLGNALRLAELLVLDRARIQGATGRIAHEREQLLGGGRTRRFLPYLGMCEDAADGQFVLDGDGRLDLRWDSSASERNLLELENAMRQLSEALGGVYVPSPLWAVGGRELLTAHPLGGCAMAAHAEDGVVDSFGAVHGYPDLFVLDGSIVPTALTRNPTATISALAERAVFHMIHGRELSSDDAQTPANHPFEGATGHEPAEPELVTAFAEGHGR